MEKDNHNNETFLWYWNAHSSRTFQKEPEEKRANAKWEGRSQGKMPTNEAYFLKQWVFNGGISRDMDARKVKIIDEFIERKKTQLETWEIVEKAKFNDPIPPTGS